MDREARTGEDWGRKGKQMQPATRRGFLGGLAAAGLYAQTGAADIFQAAASGDVKRATEILDAQPELARARREDGRTPMHVAASAGKPEMVMLLLGRGA